MCGWQWNLYINSQWKQTSLSYCIFIFVERLSVQVNPEFQSLFPSKVVSRLSSWKRSTYEDFSTLSYTKPARASGLAGPSDLYFTAIVDRGSGMYKDVSVLYQACPGIRPGWSQWSLLYSYRRQGVRYVQRRQCPIPSLPGHQAWLVPVISTLQLS